MKHTPHSVLTRLLTLLFILHVGSPALSASPLEPPEDQRPPNIVIIFTDDQGYQDVGCYGAEGFKTPHLDQLASEGIKFTNFYVAQPVCSASRAALLTGCYPNRLGIHGALMPDSDIGLNPEETTLAELLKTQGYATAAFGKWHLGHQPQFLPTRQGFDQYYGLPYSNDMWTQHPDNERHQFPPLPLIENETVIDTVENDQRQLTTQYTARAVQFIEENKDQPFFLYVPHSMPHVPLFVSDKFAGATERGLYGDVIAEIDWSVGQIVQALEQHGLTDNTLVVFTSDNGPWLSYGEHSGRALPLREGKGTSWEGGVRVPCIMRWPGQIPAGVVSDQPAMTIDVLPTVADIVEAPLPEHPIDGKSILPIIKHQPNAKSPHEAYYFYYKKNELHAVLSGDWKLYFPHEYRTLNERTGRSDGIPIPYDHIDLPAPELYNLAEDTQETNNVAADYPEVVERLSALGDTARQQLGDALTGQVGEAVRAPGRVASSGE